MKADEFSALIAGLQSEGISRTQIANGAGLSRATVWRLAEGECRQPGYETITRLKNFAAIAKPVSDMKQR